MEMRNMLPVIEKSEFFTENIQNVLKFIVAIEKQDTYFCRKHIAQHMFKTKIFSVVILPHIISGIKANNSLHNQYNNLMPYWLFYCTDENA